MERFTLGLDIGIGSVGWAAINQEKGELIDMGVRMFDSATLAQEPRKNRSARRTLRRKRWRKNQLKKAFQDFGLLTKKDFKKEGFLSYTTENDQVHRPKDDTIHHLRKRALNEKVSRRELFLALYNICGTRGHFLLENIDFSREPISFDLFKERFYELADPYVAFDNNKKEFEDEILIPMFDEKINSKEELKNAIKKNYTLDDKSDNALINLCNLIKGYKGDLAKIDESVIPEERASKPSKTSAIELAKEDVLSEYCNNIVELYDLINVHHILKEYEYICEFNVSKLDDIYNVYALRDTDPEAYNERKKQIQEKMNGKLGDRLRVVRNIENKFPNGLYVKEARDILTKQKKFYPEITSEFIEVCTTIISARIPYYIGPLSAYAKNSWVSIKGPFKYSYGYSKDESVDEFESIQKWKKAMISRCTYLPDEYALPKGSFIGETFSILNELNILSGTDKNGEFYYLKTDDKIRVFDELFLKNSAVKYSDVAELLGLDMFGTKAGEYKKKFNNQFSLYPAIAKIIPELQVKSIEDIFIDQKKVEKIEQLILNINLFDEETSKKEYFSKRENYDEETAKALSKLKAKGFYSFSKKFLMDTGMNEDGESLLSIMFGDNTESHVNEQMTIINSATDTDGNPIHFASNKYLKKMDKDTHLSVDLLIQDGKPFIPISRQVIRSLNQCFKVYEEVIKIYGVPERVVIETARDLKDSSRSGEIPAKHFNQMKGCYGYLVKELKSQKKRYQLMQGKMDEWEEIERYLTKNKRKIELYIRQNGQDMISGETIKLNHLEEYEIDHVLPRGFGDNSMDNSMLIHQNYNTKKGDRTPLEYIESEEVTTQGKDHRLVTSGQYRARCKALFDLKMISEKKLKQLLLPNTKEAMGFINRNLVDTRYIIREFMSVLRAYNEVKEYDTHIVALQSAFTSVYKQAFNIRKNRDIGDQHHALDAATVAITDKVLSAYYPNYDQRGNQKAYQKFLHDMKDALEEERTNREKINSFIRHAYNKAYGNYPNDYNSLVSEVKRTCPLYAVKIDKNYKGEFFNATLYPPRKDTDKLSPLDILKVNNEKRSFRSINSVAVDFYKYTNKKGKKTHVAIHIPKVMVNESGEIKKEKYISLIKDYYKVPELLDDDGNIKEYYFRFRAFKNDLVYETKNKTIQKFNIGSIMDKKLEFKHIYVFSYDEIYKQFYFYRKELARAFDFKLQGVNPGGSKKVTDYSMMEIAEFLIDNLIEINDDNHEKKRNTLMLKLGNEKNYYELLEKAAYYNLIVNRQCTPPKIEDQYRPVANKSEFDNNDIEYIKLKYNTLGIRYGYNDDDALVIEGPRGKKNAFSKIRKEDFSWMIGN